MTQVKVPPAISSDLENAVYDDWKRQAVDTAKKRAVSQFADYDTFKNMVSVAHLRPIGAEKRSNGVSVTTAALLGKDGRIIIDKGLQDDLPSVNGDAIAETGIQFRKAWRRSHTTKEARRKFLKQHTPQQLQRLFKVEIDSLLLSEIIDVLLWDVQMKNGLQAATDNASQLSQGDGTSPLEDVVGALSVLNAICHAGNFGMSAQLLPHRAVTKLTEFFQEVVKRSEASGELNSVICPVIGNGTTLVQLAQKYRVVL